MPAHTSPSVPCAIQTLHGLLGRYSLGPKHLQDPGPDDTALRQMLQAALRAPDHARLAPWRLVLVRGPARERLAALFQQAALASGKTLPEAALDAERALKAPVTVAWVARIDMGHPLVPAHEQWIALGAALGSFMNAAHLLGFAGKMLSGRKARSALVTQAFCGPGETLVGWLAMGTPARPPAGRAAHGVPADRMQDWAQCRVGRPEPVRSETA